MANWYVDSATGNDSNSGASWALAKKTLAGGNAVATSNVGDVIYVTGWFNEKFPVTKVVTWQGFGRATIDGSGFTTGMSPSGLMTFSGFRFVNWTSMISGNGVFIATGAGNVYVDCVFAGSNYYGIYVFNAYCNIIRCQFTGCTIAGIATSLGTGVTNIQNCSLYGNGIDIYHMWVSSSPYYSVRQCCFGSPIMVKTASNIFAIATTNDWNCFNFSTGKNVFNSVDKTTLADWKAAVGSPIDANSIDRAWASDVVDPTRGLLRPTIGSYLLTAGPSGGIIGLTNPAAGVSNGVNASLWTGATFSNCAVDGSGNIALTGGNTLGTATLGVMDLGTPQPVLSVDLGTLYESATNTVDTSFSDSPGFLTAEIRGSNSSFAQGDPTPTWYDVPIGADISAYLPSVLFRYWQIRLTLRG